ncbi:hypothetical protein FCJ60_14670 [Burkholderia metallica]|nr:hypothetical protein [Burkholderia metallica]
MRRRSAKIDGQAPRECPSCSRWISGRSGRTAGDDDSMTLRAGRRYGMAVARLSRRRCRADSPVKHCQIAAISRCLTFHAGLKAVMPRSIAYPWIRFAVLTQSQPGGFT